MFLVTDVPADGPQLGQYRNELRRVFSLGEFQDFLAERLNETLEHEVGPALGLEKALDTILGKFARAGTLKALLVAAIRFRATHLPFARMIAEPLGLSELVTLAEELVARQSAFPSGKKRSAAASIWRLSSYARRFTKTDWQAGSTRWCGSTTFRPWQEFPKSRFACSGYISNGTPRIPRRPRTFGRGSNSTTSRRPRCPRTTCSPCAACSSSWRTRAGLSAR